MVRLLQHGLYMSNMKGENMNFEYELFETDGVLGIKIYSNPLILGDYELLETCLDTDIRDDMEILTWIDDVLASKVDKNHCGGTVTIAEFDKNKTEIVIGITDTPEKCTLPTWLFREIVEVWLKEVKKHFEANHEG